MKKISIEFVSAGFLYFVKGGKVKAYIAIYIHLAKRQTNVQPNVYLIVTITFSCPWAKKADTCLF